MRVFVRQYSHYVFYNPRMVSRIMGSLNATFFVSITMILLCNIWSAEYSRTLTSTSDLIKDEMKKIPNLMPMFCFTCLCVCIAITYGLDLQMPVRIIYNNEDKLGITKLKVNLCFTTMMILINLSLVAATYNRSLCSISIWLLVHITHMLYSLTINLWVGVAKGQNALIFLALFNTFLYLLFITEVALFWLEERCSMHIALHVNDKAATSQERMA